MEIEKLQGSKFEVPQAKSLNDKWLEKPSDEHLAAYQNPQDYPLTPNSTIKEAIIHFTASRPLSILSGSKLPLVTRYPYILEELSRLASQGGQELLNHTSTQELRQDLSWAIETTVSIPGFTWQWHDQFQPEVVGQSGFKEREDSEEGNQEMDELLNSIMGLDKVKELVTQPFIGSEVKRILATAVKVM